MSAPAPTKVGAAFALAGLLMLAAMPSACAHSVHGAHDAGKGPAAAGKPPIAAGRDRAAAPPGVKDGATAPVTRAGLTFAPNSCDREQQEAVIEAFAAAKQQLAAGRAFLRANPEHEHVVKWFGEHTQKYVNRVLEATHLRVSNPVGLTIECSQQVGTCAARTFAFARPGSEVIGLCPVFFRRPLHGRDSRLGIIVHEVSHLAGGTQDHAYSPQQAEELAKSDPIKAAGNADSYEYFIEFLPGSPGASASAPAAQGLPRK
ncbi:MAG: M35 family metallopeptidase [Alphaproteobacteria bacterium]|nr:M35 family metallopeptidase [Alphaproteobacteria bacterium]